MSKLLFSGVLFLLVSLGSCSPIQCQKSQVFKDLREAIINKEQTAVDLAHEIDVEYIHNWISVDEDFYGEYYWLNPNRNRPFETTFIILALFYNQINVVEILIKKGVNVFIWDHYGNTALHVASCLGDKAVVDMILKRLAPQDINVPNRSGSNALHMAITYSKADVVKELLKQFADPFITDRFKNTALHRAIAQSFGTELISMIIDVAMQQMTCPCRDSDIVSEEMSKFINLQNRNGKTALMMAVRNMNCCVEIVDLLFKNGANPLIVDIYGNTALGVASLWGRCEMFICPLLTAVRKQIINNLGQNVMTGPSVWSSRNLVQDGRDSDMIRESMLEFINSRRHRGKSALHNAIATFDCSVETIEILLKNGADPRICDVEENTALAVAIFYKRDVNIISLIITAAREQIIHNLGQNVWPSPNLVQDGRNSDSFREAMSKFINSRNCHGNTALLNAIRKDCSVETLKILLENGADPRIHVNNGNTALGLAIFYKRGVNVISPIITAAKEQIIHNLGQNVMTGPSVWSSPNLIQDDRDKNAILEAMSEFINGRNLRGQTALLISFECAFSIETVKILLKNGADPRIPDDNGETALDLAVRNERHDAIIEILKAVRHKPKLLFLQNGMTGRLYSGLIQHLTHHRLNQDAISIIFADDMINLWKKCAEHALAWAMSTNRVDLVDSLRTICDSTGTEKPIDVSKQLPSVSKDC
uniref:Uncharacterized protein n=1 Tax=Spongospora subterranea TaxID=70186 RepID=A0A0H5R1S8_9EUKA|eukprot:CRZ07877.1 hypothetical protein [Spongospora subterranea]